MRHWLMKSEPDTFGIDDLARVRIEPWTGVRNYQARNFMRDMAIGDAVLFYHSNATPPGVAGLARVVETGVVDDTQFDPKSPYHDPASDRATPRWDCVRVEFVEKFADLVTLDELRVADGLGDMLVIRRGMRLSVQPVTADEYAIVVAMGHGGARPRIAAPAAPGAKPAAKPAKATAKATACSSLCG